MNEHVPERKDGVKDTPHVLFFSCLFGENSLMSISRDKIVTRKEMVSFFKIVYVSIKVAIYLVHRFS
jgi:hypothetical protein